MIEKR
jgi:hypothetical protein